MQRFFTHAGLALLLSVFSGLTFAQSTATSCIPSFISANKNYYVFMEGKEHKVKVLSIVDNSCWIEVKEDLPKSVDEKTLSNKRKSAYWININQVVSIKPRN